MVDEARKDGWDKAKIAATIFGMVAVPIAIAVFGSLIDSSIKNKEIRLRTVEIAVSILAEEPKEGEHSNHREWAVDVVDQYSEVPLSDLARQELLTKRLRAIGLHQLELQKRFWEENFPDQ